MAGIARGKNGARTHRQELPAAENVMKSGNIEQVQPLLDGLRHVELIRAKLATTPTVEISLTGEPTESYLFKTDTDTGREMLAVYTRIVEAERTRLVQELRRFGVTVEEESAGDPQP
jgi:hypothetical protein